jgi:hypothetical protein
MLKPDERHAASPCNSLVWQLLKDPMYEHIPCGDNFFSGKFRPGCTLPCCVVYPGEETDSDWDSQATVLDEQPSSQESAQAE